MPFGLCNAPATFERLMDRVLARLPPTVAMVYIDDILVPGRIVQQQIDNLKQVFQRLREAKLKLSPKKCSLFQKEVRFLGHVISRQGITTDPGKVMTVQSWPQPTSVKELSSFLGLCSYYRKFISGFASIAQPLHQLTEKGRRFGWTADAEQAFARLKEALTQAPVLAYPLPCSQFILDTDASDCAVGAVLSQLQDGEEHVIAYYSQALSRQERQYCVTRR